MSKSTSQKLYIARGFFAALAGLLALATLILLGTNMDYANFPGSNLILENITDSSNGFKIKDSSATCSNFKELKNLDSTKICDSVKDDAAVALEVVDESGAVSTLAAHGWIIGPPCVKTDTVTDCAPFGFSSALSGLGQATFATLPINVVLYGTHTGILSESKKSALFVLNIVWTITSFILYVWAAFAWGALCDKIDTGLGRHTDVGSACATSLCSISFGGLTASFATAILVAHVPSIVTFFGLGGLSEEIANQYNRLNSEDDEDDDEDV